MSDYWTEMSYYQFPFFYSKFKRDTYEKWYDDFNDDYNYKIKEQEGEEEC